MATKIQLRRDTAANWTSSNPTLSQGEIGYETDTRKKKIGDGTTAWTSLQYDVIETSASVLIDVASIALSQSKSTLTTASATRTFTISYTGDDITIEVTLNTTASVFTFPVTSLCVSEGTASGDNTLSLSGVSGDKYIIGIKKVGSAYYVVSKNFGQ